MIIHETPGLLDTRSFTTFGINAKPNAKSPIGMFGTGLKYSIAVLMRQALKVTVWIGDQPYEFLLKNPSFEVKISSQFECVGSEVLRAVGTLKNYRTRLSGS